MTKKMPFGSVAVLAIVAIAVIAILVTRALPVVGALRGGLDDFEDTEVRVVLEDFDVLAFLPVAQLFIGQPILVEESGIDIETGQVTTDEFSITLPSGWSQVDEHVTENTVAVLLESEDGDFATVIAVDSLANPDQYIQNFITEHNRMLELAGFTITTYSMVTADGYSAQAVDADGPGLVTRLRGWYDEEAQKVYIVTLTCQPQNLVASQIILEGPSTGTTS